MQTGIVSTPFGRRTMTLGMLATQLQAQEITPEKSVDKWKLYRALCEARSRLGVTDRALALLNALLSFHPHGSLSAATGLIVFPSNAQLSLRANGMAEATIRRHLAVLVQAGLLARRDSANGKRYARRSGEGTLDEAFGFSLAPLLARSDEIERLAAEAVSERLALQRMKERLTICRRDITKLVETAMEEGVAGDWEAILIRMRAELVALPRTAGLADVGTCLNTLETIREDIINRLQTLTKSHKKIGSPDQNERHIQNSNTESPPESEPLSKEEQGEMAAVPIRPVRTAPDRLEIKAFPLGMVLQASPEMADYGPGGAIASWRDLMAAAVVVRSTLGVSPSAYQDACEAMGPEVAATVMACILARAGHINSPGGYLRNLTDRAREGAFSPGPMLMALMREHSTTAKRTG